MRRIVRFRRRRQRDEEKGASLIEAALVLPLLIMLAIGSAETGLTFVDWLSVTNATREGARVGAAAGTSPIADESIKSVVTRATCNIQNGEMTRIRVFKADENGEQYEAGIENIYEPLDLDCDDLSELEWDDTYPVNWPPGDRNSTVGNLDYLGVEVTFTHRTITGLFPMFNATWTDQTVMRIDPNVQGTEDD